MNLNTLAAKWIKKTRFYSSHLRPGYSLMFTSRQLKFLMDCLDKTANVEGVILEIGCAYGSTTIFLKEYIRDSGINKDYICIDTFDGFTDTDISFELTNRGKPYSYKNKFKNDLKWFKRNLASRNINDVQIIQADINKLDPSVLSGVSFCLLDVDLFRPVTSGLKLVYPILNTGGIIVVDDCWITEEHFVPILADKFDGALYAYRKFLQENNLPEEIVEGKLGVITKQ